MFLDESGFNTAMTRGYAHAPSHLRAVGRVARNHGLNYILICAMSLVGPLALLVIDGPLNGEVFEWYVREVLCPMYPRCAKRAQATLSGGVFKPPCTRLSRGRPARLSGWQVSAQMLRPST